MKLILIVLCLALVGCGGGDVDREQLDATPTAVPTETETAEPVEPTEQLTEDDAASPAPTEDLPATPSPDQADPFEPAATPEGSNDGWTGRIDIDHETGEVTAPGFNDVVEAQQPSWAQTPERAAEALLHLGEETEEPQGTVEVDVQGDDDSPRVTVTISDQPDDSVNAVRYEIVFERGDDGLLRFVEGTWSQRCQPGRGHQDFRAELCV